ncbi:MAG: DUF7575 domain-containing protein [Planctomycetota bacterium]
MNEPVRSDAEPPAEGRPPESCPYCGAELDPAFYFCPRCAMPYKAADSVADELAIEALARGYVRCEYYDEEGKYLVSVEIRVAGLRENETAEVTVPLPRRRPARMVVTY